MLVLRETDRLFWPNLAQHAGISQVGRTCLDNLRPDTRLRPGFGSLQDGVCASATSVAEIVLPSWPPLPRRRAPRWKNHPAPQEAVSLMTLHLYMKG